MTTDGRARHARPFGPTRNGAGTFPPSATFLGVSCCLVGEWGRVSDVEVGKPRILVIEDEAMIRLDLVESLQELGCEVIEAFSLGDARRHLADGVANFSAIVTDIGLPDGRGDAFAVQIRAQRPDVPVIVATGYAVPEMREQFRSDPKVAVVMKPYSAEQIIATLRKLGMRDLSSRA